MRISEETKAVGASCLFGGGRRQMPVLSVKRVPTRIWQFRNFINSRGLAPSAYVLSRAGRWTTIGGRQ